MQPREEPTTLGVIKQAVHNICTTYDTQKIFEVVNQTLLQKDKEAIFKSYGLCLVKVGFI